MRYFICLLYYYAHILLFLIIATTAAAQEQEQARNGGGTATTAAADAEFITMLDCVNAFGALQFDLVHFHRYETFFRNESKMVLAAAGEYVGAVEIEEYVRYADASSPYLSERETVAGSTKFKSVNQSSAECVFISHATNRAVMDTNFAQEATYLSGRLAQVHYNFRDGYITKVYLHFPEAFLDFFFDKLLSNDRTRNYICDVSDQCPDTNVGITRPDCLDALKNLPIFTDGRIDGLDYGCRTLHAVFASTNHAHCPHISFLPQPDRKGAIKCQQSKGLVTLDYFDQNDLNDFLDYLASPTSLIESASGLKILYMPKSDIETKRRIWLGLVVPVSIFTFTMLVLWRTEPKEDGKTKTRGSNPLFVNKARRLWIVGVTIVGSLIVANALAAVIISAIAEEHPEWDNDNSSAKASNNNEDRYRGEAGIFSQTVPQHQLTDEQFRVYSGFIIWVTCLLAGLGLEVFVWYHFLQVWCEVRESVWRFVQFIFPIMLVTSLGLALHRDFLALPMLVTGLWKFGFPETLMYLYLGLFAPTRNRAQRLSDILNGMGTAIHHGAAAMVVSMLVAGVIPQSRYVLNCCLILVMQHWVVLLAYVSTPLYTGIELVLEYYFEWIIISDFPEIYHLHWTAALTAGAMIFAHWLYLAAATLELCGSTTAEGQGEGNVHTRGQEIISQMHQQNPDIVRQSIRRQSVVRSPSFVSTSTIMNRQQQPKPHRRRSTATAMLADHFFHQQFMEELTSFDKSALETEFDSNWQDRSVLRTREILEEETARLAI